MNETKTKPTVTPRLIVPDVDAAIAFYRATLGAEPLERYEDEKRGIVVHAAIRVGESTLTFAQEAPEWHNRGPGLLGGSPVILQVVVDDALAVGEAMEANGAEVIFPIADQFYGRREGRLRDPFGHVWIVSQLIEELAPDEIERRIAAFEG